MHKSIKKIITSSIPLVRERIFSTFWYLGYFSLKVFMGMGVGGVCVCVCVCVFRVHVCETWISLQHLQNKKGPCWCNEASSARRASPHRGRERRFRDSLPRAFSRGTSAFPSVPKAWEAAGLRSLRWSPQRAPDLRGKLPTASPLMQSPLSQAGPPRDFTSAPDLFHGSCPSS